MADIRHVSVLRCYLPRIDRRSTSASSESWVARSGGNGIRFVEERVGTGLLRASGYAAATAEYVLRLRRRISGPRAGEVVAEGRLKADVNILLAAIGVGGAVLDLADGHSFAIQLTKVESAEAMFIGIASALDG